MADAHEAFATLEDLEGRWRPLSLPERKRAALLLEDAESLIKDECPRWHTASEATLRRIACKIVQRALNTPFGEDVGAIQQTSTTAGPYSQQMSYANPQGDMYLTKAEKRALGGGALAAFEADLLGGSR